MTDRPILFSAPMVRALLNGSKTQTRRVAKLTDAGHVKEVSGHRRWHPADPAAKLACPYGQPGDRLWVRETWLKTNPFTDGGMHTYGYRASDAIEFPDAIWKPSIHMPRVASRITLDVTGVRVERLQDISEADAKAEGLRRYREKGIAPDLFCNGITDGFIFPVDAYSALWESINGDGSWDVNPLVWVVEFKVVS